MKRVWFLGCLLFLAGCGRDEKAYYFETEVLSDGVESLAEAGETRPGASGLGNALAGIVQKLFSSKTEIASPNLGHAIPKGTNPFDLTGCKEGKKSFRKQLKSTLGFNIVTAEYEISYLYACKYKGKGNYIANAKVTVTSSKVDPFWSLTVSGVSDAPINAGTQGAPNASLTFSATFIAEGVGSESSTDDFKVTAADGVLNAKVREFAKK